MTNWIDSMKDFRSASKKAKPLVLFPPRGGARIETLLRLQGELPRVQETLEHTGRYMGLDLSRPSLALDAALHDGFAGQLLEVAMAVGLYRSLLDEGVEPRAIAVHCLGVYTSLIAANCVSLEDGLSLLVEHIRCVSKEPGELGSITNFPVSQVVNFCREIDRVSVSTLNGPSVCTVSGDMEGLAKVELWARQQAAGFRRLSSFGPWHCPNLTQIGQSLKASTLRCIVNDADVPLFFPLAHPVKVRRKQNVAKAIISQMTSPVFWEDLSRDLLSRPGMLAVEVGPLPVLSRFHKKNSPERRKILTLLDRASLKKVVSRLEQPTEEVLPTRAIAQSPAEISRLSP